MFVYWFLWTILLFAYLHISSHFARFFLPLLLLFGWLLWFHRQSHHIIVSLPLRRRRYKLNRCGIFPLSFIAKWNSRSCPNVRVFGVYSALARKESEKPLSNALSASISYRVLRIRSVVGYVGWMDRSVATGMSLRGNMIKWSIVRYFSGKWIPIISGPSRSRIPLPWYVAEWSIHMYIKLTNSMKWMNSRNSDRRNGHLKYKRIINCYKLPATRPIR